MHSHTPRPRHSQYTNKGQTNSQFSQENIWQLVKHCLIHSPTHTHTHSTYKHTHTHTDASLTGSLVLTCPSINTFIALAPSWDSVVASVRWVSSSASREATNLLHASSTLHRVWRVLFFAFFTILCSPLAYSFSRSALYMGGCVRKGMWGCVRMCGGRGCYRQQGLTAAILM